MSDHMPAGFRAITPYLSIADPKAFFAFVTDGLGATVRAEHYDGDRLAHAEVEWLGCILEVGQSSSPRGGGSIGLHVFVEDPDAVYARALAHGATSLYEVTDHPYGERSGGVTDPAGIHWYFARVIDHEARSV